MFFSFLLEEFQKTGHLSFSKYCKLTLQTSTIDPSSMQGSALANFRTCGSQNLQILKLQASALIDRRNNFTIRTLNSKFKVANFKTSSSDLQMLRLQASALIDRLNNFTIRTLNSKFKVANFKTSTSDLQMLRLQASALIDRLNSSQFEPWIPNSKLQISRRQLRTCKC